jgi:hypothetical protein
VSVGTSIVPPGSRPPPADTPDASSAVTTPQVTASHHDFAASLGREWRSTAGAPTNSTDSRPGGRAPGRAEFGSETAPDAISAERFYSVAALSAGRVSLTWVGRYGAQIPCRCQADPPAAQPVRLQ